MKIKKVKQMLVHLYEELRHDIVKEFEGVERGFVKAEEADNSTRVKLQAMQESLSETIRKNIELEKRSEIARGQIAELAEKLARGRQQHTQGRQGRPRLPPSPPQHPGAAIRGSQGRRQRACRHTCTQPNLPWPVHGRLQDEDYQE